MLDPALGGIEDGQRNRQMFKLRKSRFLSVNDRSTTSYFLSCTRNVGKFVPDFAPIINRSFSYNAYVHLWRGGEDFR